MPQTIDRSVELGDINTGLWWLGWRPLESVLVGAAAGLVIGNGIAIVVGLVAGVHTLVTMGAFTAVGAALGLLGWYVGAHEINDGYRSVLEGFAGGATGAGSDVTIYALIGDGHGSKPLVEAPVRYESTYFGFEPSSLHVYEGRLDLVGRTPKLEDSLEIPYDSIEGVDYDGDAVVVSTTRGDTFRYPTADEPTAALAELRARL
ncbi:MAG: hypothetical protein ABEJ89_06035 [Haloarculaceae archaeon]